MTNHFFNNVLYNIFFALPFILQKLSYVPEVLGEGGGCCLLTIFAVSPTGHLSFL